MMAALALGPSCQAGDVALVGSAVVVVVVLEKQRVCSRPGRCDGEGAVPESTGLACLPTGAMHCIPTTSQGTYRRLIL